jgi:plastocyanin
MEVRSMTDSRMLLRVLCVICAVVLGPVGSAFGGTVRGVVRFTVTPVEKKTVNVTVDRSVCGMQKDAEDLVVASGGGLRNAVVSLSTPALDAGTGGPDAKARTAHAAQVDQKECVFVPRVVVVPAGGTVEFLNSDRLLHNLHSVSKVNAVFNRTQPKGRTIPIVFKRPEIIRIDCDLHPWMRAWVVVADHPFYVVTGDGGDFVLDNVPPGRYTAHVWHESLGTVQRDLAVGDGTVTVTVEMSGK